MLDSRDRIAQPACTVITLQLRRPAPTPRALAPHDMAEYRKPQPVWEPCSMSTARTRWKENWVWKNAQCLPPRGDRCLLSVARRGDAIVVREFDLAKKQFVADGFH